MDDPRSIIYIPIELDAFVVNPKVCQSPPVRISPLIKPDYAGLRLDGRNARHDLLPRVDVSLSGNPSGNPRICATRNLTQEPSAVLRRDGHNVDEKRTGIHLAWRLPQCYRMGFSEDTSHITNSNPQGVNRSIPRFPRVPDRWLVARRVHDSVPSLGPDGSKENVRQVEMWMIEADRIRRLDELPPELDLEMEVSPYVYRSYSADHDHARADAETFIGNRVPWNDWSEEPDAQPRIAMTNMSASNPYFLDCAMHNINCQSFFDDLSYYDGEGDQKTLQYFKEAECSYTVFGFHSSHDDDPISGSNSVYGGSVQYGEVPLKTRLKQMRIDSSSLNWKEIDPGAASALTKKLNTFLFGKLSRVTFKTHEAPSIIQANEFAKAFTDQVGTEPLGIGLTTFDALVALLRAHKLLGAHEKDNPLLNLEAFKLAADGDDYDSSVKASDIVQSHIYRDLAAGIAWKIEFKPNRQNKKMSEGEVSRCRHLLRQLNEIQTRHDSLSRLLKSLRWDLFAEYFTSVSAITTLSDTEAQKARDRVETCRHQIQNSIELLETDSGKIESLVTQLSSISQSPQKSAGKSFFQRKAPALCFAGLQLDGLERKDTKLRAFTHQDLIDCFDPPTDDEFVYWEKTKAHKVTSKKIDAFLEGVYDCLGYGSKIIHTFLSKDWVEKQQTWSPLYVEWEVEYFDIPMGRWTTKLRSRAEGTNHTHLHYQIIDSGTPLMESVTATRRFVGRSSLISQAGFSLRALIEDILNRKGVKQNDEIPKPGKERNSLLEMIEQLPFASIIMDELTSHLVTRGSSTHVKPNFRGRDLEFVALDGALDAVATAAFNSLDLTQMADATAQTPYGDLVEPGEYDGWLFHGVTHGQFVVRRLDIVDKFGQVVTAPVPRQSHEQPQGNQNYVHPCVSDLLSPGHTKDKHWNTVISCTETASPDSQPLCPFIQLTPAINQPARLNTAFVIPAETTASDQISWSTTTDQENPIWGWIIINFADKAFQLYNGDGSFITECRTGGPKGIQLASMWVPFKPSQAKQDHVSQNMHDLLLAMTGPNGFNFVQTFWNAIVASLDSVNYAPGEYATSSSAIVGRPLALVNLGVSLELADAPLEPQTSRVKDNRNSSNPPKLLDYEFDYKIGDTERPYDGVIAYFNCQSRTTGKIDLTTIYASLPTDQGVQPQIVNMDDLRSLNTRVSPYWIDPSTKTDDRSFSQRHDDMFAVSARSLNVKCLLVDPYSPIHVFTGMLPTASLTLPHQLVQRVLSKIATFFTVGPTLLSNDIRPEDALRTGIDDDDNWQLLNQMVSESKNQAGLRLPFKSKKGDWLWLQPYADIASPVNVHRADELSASDGRELFRPRYDAFEVGVDSTIIGQMSAPPSVVEGYLQPLQPLNRSEDRHDSSAS